MITVNIEYCVKCGYQPRYDELENQIKQAFPDVRVIGADGRTGSFEIYIEEQLIFSKLEKGGFPVFTEVVDVVKMAVEKGEVVLVEGTQPSSCSVM